MNTGRNPYLWLTDTHLMPWARYKMLNTILDAKPKGVFLTGDISNSSQTLIGDLDFLGQRIGRPLYFTLGNHDIHFSSFEKTHSKVRELCLRHKNLHWMDEAGIIPLNEEVCVIGHGSWYDARIGNPEYIKYTFDWRLIDEFKQLSSIKDVIEKCRALADESADILCGRLEQALETYKVVYALLHIPPFREAHRAKGFISEKFYEPYNINFGLGQRLEKVMEKHKKRYLHCLAGHCHMPVSIQVSRSIECRVGKGSYHKISEEEIIYI